MDKGSLLKGQWILCLQKVFVYYKKKIFYFFNAFWNYFIPLVVEANRCFSGEICVCVLEQTDVCVYAGANRCLCVCWSKQMLYDANDSDVHDTFTISD